MPGVLETFGSEAIESQYLPAQRSVGEMVSIALTSGPPTVFLEVPVDCVSRTAKAMALVGNADGL